MSIDEHGCGVKLEHAIRLWSYTCMCVNFSYKKKTIIKKCDDDCEQTKNYHSYRTDYSSLRCAETCT